MIARFIAKLAHLIVEEFRKLEEPEEEERHKVPFGFIRVEEPGGS